MCPHEDGCGHMRVGVATREVGVATHEVGTCCVH